MEIQGKWICYKHWAKEKRRPHHKARPFISQPLKFPPPAIRNLPPHLKRSSKIPRSRAAWMELTGAWPKWRAGAPYTQDDFSILSCLFEISSHHSSMNSANTASVAFHQLNWQGQNFEHTCGGHISEISLSENRDYCKSEKSELPSGKKCI